MHNTATRIMHYGAIFGRVWQLQFCYSLFFVISCVLFYTYMRKYQIEFNLMFLTFQVKVVIGLLQWFHYLQTTLTLYPQTILKPHLISCSSYQEATRQWSRTVPPGPCRTPQTTTPVSTLQCKNPDTPFIRYESILSCQVLIAHNGAGEVIY